MIFSKDFQWISRSKASILNQSSPKAFLSPDNGGTEGGVKTIENLSAFSVRFVFGFCLAIALCLSMCSCSSAKHAVTVVDHVTHDTLYFNKVQYDSIYINSAHNMDYRRDQRWDSIVVWNEEIHKPYTINPKPLVDTMYIRDKNVEYKYRLLHDTTYVHKVDTIPVIKEVTVTQQVKYIPWYAKTFAWIGVICLLLVAIYLVIKLVFKR